MKTQTGALKLALEKYMAAYGQALEVYGIKLQQQQIEADRFAREALALAEQPAQQCKWPTCQNEEYQQALADQIKRELAGEQPAQRTEQEIVALREALASSLDGVYVCDRAWSAWSVGTMSEDDFYPASESDEVLDSLVSAVTSQPRY